MADVKRKGATHQFLRGPTLSKDLRPVRNVVPICVAHDVSYPKPRVTSCCRHRRSPGVWNWNRKYRFLGIYFFSNPSKVTGYEGHLFFNDQTDVIQISRSIQSQFGPALAVPDVHGWMNHWNQLRYNHIRRSTPNIYSWQANCFSVPGLKVSPKAQWYAKTC